MYSSVSDAELVSVFGDEATINKSVYKTISVDQNKVSTITYKSKSGEVLATCLNYTQGDTLLQNLPLSGIDTKDTGITKTITEIVTDDVRYSDNCFILSKNLTLTEEYTNVNMFYTIIPDVLQKDTCLSVCETCDYKGLFKCKKYRNQPVD